MHAKAIGDDGRRAGQYERDNIVRQLNKRKNDDDIQKPRNIIALETGKRMCYCNRFERERGRERERERERDGIQKVIAGRLIVRGRAAVGNDLIATAHPLPSLVLFP
eukprot:sb/3477660/